jgi:acetolactate synthase small subunit
MTFPNRMAVQSAGNFCAGSPEPRATYWYFLVADAEPGLLPRVLGQFAKRSLVPEHLHCSQGPDGLHLDIRAGELEPQTAQILAAALRQIVGIRSVLSTGG